MPLVPPTKKLTLLTEEVLSAMTPTQFGGGYLTDQEVPMLAAWRFSRKPDQIKFMCDYTGKKLVVDGFLRTKELIGIWPAMSIDQARDIARDRTRMMEEQKLNPIVAPPYRDHGKHKMQKKRGKKRTPASVEALLASSIPMTDEQRDRYESLMLVMMDAHSRAAEGKGAERHDNGAPFENQISAIIMDQVGEGFALGQAMKKLVESRKLPWDEARNERLDAMVYIASSIIWKDQGGK